MSFWTFYFIFERTEAENLQNNQALFRKIHETKNYFYVIVGGHMWQVVEDVLFFEFSQTSLIPLQGVSQQENHSFFFIW